MKKLTTILSTIVVLLFVSVLSYAQENSTSGINDTSENSNSQSGNFSSRHSDFYFGVDLGLMFNAGTKFKDDAKASKVFKYCDKYGKCFDIAFRSNPLSEPVEKNRETAADYFSAQFGMNFYINDEQVITPYFDFSSLQEFSGASSSTLNGIGVLGSFKRSYLSYYLAGIELHDASFDYRSLKSSKYMRVPKAGAKLSYSGDGITLTGGLLYKTWTYKLLYIMNNYKRDKISTGDEFSNAIYRAYTPQKIDANSFGLSVGFKF